MATWDELFKHEKWQWKEPEACVVELAEELERDRGRRVYDLGCGAGRHVVYLASRGFEVVGSDPSERGLAITREWLAGEGLEATLVVSDMTRIPFPDEHFDAVVSIKVLHHNDVEGFTTAVGEIERVLKHGGLLLFEVASREHGNYGAGRVVSPHTFVLGEGDEAGILHHFFSEGELRRILADFNILRMEPNQKGSHWIVLAEKP